MQEVGLGGTAAAGDEPDTHRQLAQGTSGVGTQQSLRLEACEQLGTRYLELAQRVGGVDGGHAQLQLAPRCEPVDPAPDTDLGAISHPHRAARGGERPVDSRFVASREHHVDAGTRAVLALLDQREVDVPGCRARDVADLAPHPHLVGEARSQHTPDRVGQLADRQGRLR